MSDDSVQNYGNHRRWFPPYHFVVMPILAINGRLGFVRRPAWIDLAHEFAPGS